MPQSTTVPSTYFETLESRVLLSTSMVGGEGVVDDNPCDPCPESSLKGDACEEVEVYTAITHAISQLCTGLAFLSGAVFAGTLSVSLAKSVSFDSVDNNSNRITAVLTAVLAYFAYKQSTAAEKNIAKFKMQRGIPPQ